MSNIPVAYTLRIKYCAEGTVYTKEVITPAKTPMEIFPFRIVQGASIPIKYLKKVPEWFMVAIPAITEGTVQAQRSLLYKGPFAAFVITTIYVVYLVTHVL